MAKLSKGAAIFAVLVTMVGGFEGLRTYAYRDPVGIPTICYGETRGVVMGQIKTVLECKDMLGNRLIEFSSGIDKCLTNEQSIPDKTYGAFVSFAYNVGVGAFCGSTLARKANAGDLVGACNQLPRWTKAGGIELPGLVKRRNEEKALCLSGL
jgi:lysozyme